MKVPAKCLLLALGLTACTDDTTTNVPGFDTDQVYTDESDNLITLNFSLGNAIKSSTTFTFAITGTAGMDGDYAITNADDEITLSNGLTKVSSLETTSMTTSAILELEAQAGATSLSIPIKIIDDVQIEHTAETIQITLEDVSDSNLQIENSYTALRITDNDTPKDNTLQIDLSWVNLSSGSINNNNFDLYLIRNVKTSGNTLTSYDLVTGVYSSNVSGYETITLNDAIANDTYYLMIKMISGTSTSRLSLVLSEPGYWRTASATVSSSQVGEYFYFGPVSKSTSGFSFRNSNESKWFGLVGTGE